MSAAIAPLGIRKKRRFALRVVLLLLALGFVAACQSNGTVEIEGATNDSSQLPEEITFVTWNTQKLHDPMIVEDLSALTRQHKPDLVFLQEVRIEGLDSEEMDGHFAKGWSYPWPGGDTIGVVTLANSLPIRIEQVHTAWREFFVTAPKVSLVTEYLLSNGQTLLAVNVHLLNFEPWDPFMFRDQLQDLEQAMRHHEGPVIMAGDFNTWNAARLALVDDLADRLGLDETPGMLDGRKTGDLDSSLLHWVFGIQPELPLDRVYSRGFELVLAQVLPIESSDHRPVLVTLTLDSLVPDDVDTSFVAKCSNQSFTTARAEPSIHPAVRQDC